MQYLLRSVVYKNHIYSSPLISLPPVLSLFFHMHNNHLHSLTILPLITFFPPSLPIMSLTPHCIAQLECSISHIPQSMITQLLQPPSTKWISLQPHDGRILVALPNIKKAVGYIPQSIASILVKFLEAPSKYGPAGGCPLTLPTRSLLRESYMSKSLLG